MAPTPRTPRELTPFWCPLDVAAPPNGQAATRTSVERVHLATGLPLRAFRRTVATAPAPQPGGGSILGGRVPALASGGVPSVDHPGQLPFVPIPGGLLFDTIFFAIAWWGLARAMRPLRRFRPVRVVREAHRTRQGRCAACGFDLRFDLARGCPECGWRRAPGRPVR